MQSLTGLRFWQMEKQLLPARLKICWPVIIRGLKVIFRVNGAVVWWPVLNKKSGDKGPENLIRQ
jgi:hypothetical protein